ncbi:MAG: heavy metal translocating P-type ATPase [Armatimonadota bacterium]
MLETKTIDLPVTLPRGFEECARCTERLQDALLQIDGINSARVNPEKATLTLVYDPHLVPLEEVRRRASTIGASLSERFSHKTLELSGLDCPDCALKLEKGVGRLSGVLWVSTNYASSRMSVEYQPDKVDEAAISRRIRELGYGIREQVPIRPRLANQTWLTALAGVTLVLGLLTEGLPISRLFFGFSALSGGLYAARGALFSLRSMVLDMNFLMTAAAVGAIAIGEWFEAAAVMFLFSLGNALEARSVQKARDSVRSLVNLFPPTARVRRDGREVEVPAAELVAGEIFTVRPGEKIPTDGDVISGSTSVNQATVTGESAPVTKHPGDQVYAGSVNLEGSVDVRATAGAEDNTLSRIIHLVEEAQAEKAPTQRFTEVFGRYYTPAVVGLAVLVAVVPPFFAVPFAKSLYIALTLLVVSCPCALVISTPVTIVSAIASAARAGVLVKGGSHLENAGRIRAVAFDKTGTLTTGESVVSDVRPADGFTEESLLRLAAAVESRSEHPLAEAIRREAAKRELIVPDVTDFEALTGMGAAAKFDGATALVGNSRLMNQLGVEISPDFEEFQRQGKTAVLVASNGRLAGTIALADTVRESARHAFRELRRIGIEQIIMLTGDNEMTARAVAEDLAVDEYYAELLPQDKVDIVRVLISRFGSVAFVGDGVNDAPALAASTLGIAMGAVGSDTALETADVALMSDDLSKLPYTMRLGRASLAAIRQNIVFSLVVIGVLVSTALLGWLRLSLGVFGHEGSALIVIANGMRMLRFK